MDQLNIYHRASSACSEAVTRYYSTSFSKAITMLHPELHMPIHAIYGFVRIADEIVDSFHQYDKQALLDGFRAQTFTAIQDGISTNPVLQSFQWVVSRYDIPGSYIDAFFDSMYADLDKKEWRTEEELNTYIYGSAEVVGLMCLQVFCEGDSALARQMVPEARALGAAFQKVNFLRDISVDTSYLGRRYFPGLDLTTFDERLKQSIESGIEEDFRVAYSGIKRLPLKARWGVLLAYRYYYKLFNKIRKLPPKAIWKQRIRINNLHKALLLIEMSLLSRWPLTRPRT